MTRSALQGVGLIHGIEQYTHKRACHAMHKPNYEAPWGGDMLSFVDRAVTGSCHLRGWGWDLASAPFPCASTTTR